MPFLLLVQAASGRQTGQAALHQPLSPVRQTRQAALWQPLSNREAARERATALLLQPLAQARARGAATLYQSLSPAAHPQAAWPAPVVYRGQRPQRWELSCLLGTALSGSITLQEARQVAELTFAGKYYPSQLPRRVTFTLSLRGTATTVTLDTDEQYSISTAGGQTRTTLRWRNAAAERAATRQLDEVVPWHLAPRPPQPEGDATPPRTIGVMEAVVKCAGQIGLAFAMASGNPYGGEFWKEGVRDYSASGKTFTAVFSETYGKLGYTLVIWGERAYAVPPMGDLGTAALSHCALLTQEETYAVSHVPTRIRVTSPDWLVPAPPLLPEVKDIITRRETETANGITTEAITTYQGQRLIEKVSISTGTVVAREGTAAPVTFSNVLTGSEVTTIKYHPDNPEAIIREETRKLEVVYDINTKVKALQIRGPRGSTSATVGDVLRDDTDITLTSWYTPADGRLLSGYQRQKAIYQRRLKDAEQKNAEAEPSERGPLIGRGYVNSASVEAFRTRDGVSWIREYSESGGGNLPVYDTDSGDAVRLIERNSTVKTQTQGGVTPPRLNWPEPEQPPPLFPFLQRKAYALTGGRAGELSQDFPMLETGDKLDTFAQSIAQANAPRLEQSYALAGATTARPGVRIEGGRITELTASVKGSQVTVGLSLQELKPVSMRGIDWPEEELRAVVVGYKRNSSGVIKTAVVDIADGMYGSGQPIWRRDYVEIPSEPPALHSQVALALTPDGRLVIKGA